MTYMERYLRDTGDAAIVSVINDGIEEGQLFYSESGDTYKWVSILRAAELHFASKENDSLSLFRMREEGLKGESPQILVRGRDR